MIRWHGATGAERSSATSGSVPDPRNPLGFLHQIANSCDGQTWLPLLRNVRHAVVSQDLRLYLSDPGLSSVCGGDRSYGRWLTLKWQLERFSLVASRTVVQTFSPVHAVFALRLQCQNGGYMSAILTVFHLV